jgi:hypothetical protein
VLVKRTVGENANDNGMLFEIEPVVTLNQKLHRLLGRKE